MLKVDRWHEIWSNFLRVTGLMEYVGKFNYLSILILLFCFGSDCMQSVNIPPSLSVQIVDYSLWSKNDYICWGYCHSPTTKWEIKVNSLKMNQFTFGYVKITETVLMMNYQNNQLDAATAEKNKNTTVFKVIVERSESQANKCHLKSRSVFNNITCMSGTIFVDSKALF